MMKTAFRVDILMRTGGRECTGQTSGSWVEQPWPRRLYPAPPADSRAEAGEWRCRLAFERRII